MDPRYGQASLPEPDSWLTECYRTGGAANTMQMSDPRLDAMIDKQRGVLDVNQRACEIYGFTRSELLGMSLVTISKDPVRGRELLKRTLEEGVYYHFETVHQRKDGSVEVPEVLHAYMGTDVIK